MSRVVRKQNVRTWGAERSEEHNSEVMKCPIVTKFCAKSQDRVLSPYLFGNANVIGDIYRNMLTCSAFPRFRPLQQKNTNQQDGARPHYFSQVRGYLNNKRPNDWIQSGEQVAWPPFSLDLTRCNFFLQGYLKSRMAFTSVDFIPENSRRVKSEVRRTREELWEKYGIAPSFVSTL